MNDKTARSGEAASSARETIRAKAADLASNAKEKVNEQFEARVGTARTEISSVASALRRVGDQIRHENGSSFTAGLFTAIADRVESVGSSFEGRDLDGVLVDVQRLARRNPAAFAGTAAAIGFLAARFLKSSGRNWHLDQDESLAPLDLTPSTPGFSSGYDSAPRTAPAPSTATGWDVPSSPGSGLTGTAEGIGNPTTPPRGKGGV